MCGRAELGRNRQIQTGLWLDLSCLICICHPVSTSKCKAVSVPVRCLQGVKPPAESIAKTPLVKMAKRCCREQCLPGNIYPTRAWEAGAVIRCPLQLQHVRSSALGRSCKHSSEEEAGNAVLDLPLYGTFSYISMSHGTSIRM